MSSCGDPHLISDVLGCDFYVPMHQYHTQIHKRQFFFCAKVFFLRNHLLCICVAQKSDLSGPIHGYAYKMTTFLFVYSFFLFVARIEGQIFVYFWSTNKYTDAKKAAK